MGIIVMFVFVCLVIYAVLVTNGIYFLLKLILVKMLGLAISLKLLWIFINLILWAIAMRFIYFLVLDSKGGTPSLEPIWKFYLILTSILFLVVFLLGYKSK